jgi:hypothetical protein
LANNDTIRVEADLSSAFLGSFSFNSNIPFEIKEIIIVAALLQHLPEVQVLTIQLGKCHRRYATNVPVENCLSKRFPGFDSLRSHQIPSRMLQKLTRLEWWGFEFHWILARSPCLRDLLLMSPVKLVENRAPDKTNPVVTTLKLTFRSWILLTEEPDYDNIKLFLAHFPSLKSLLICVKDTGMQIEGSPFDVNDQSQASFSHLATRLDAVAPFLTNFELKTNFHGDADHSRWLYYVTPGAGFQNFCMLRSLKIPYHCLGNFDVVVWPILHYGVYPRKKVHYILLSAHERFNAL